MVWKSQTHHLEVKAFFFRQHQDRIAANGFLLRGFQCKALAPNVQQAMIGSETFEEGCKDQGSV